MQIDRYTKVMLTVIALALAAIASRPWGQLAWPTSAEAQAEFALPKAWGRLVTVYNMEWFFEAADGAIRVYRADTRAVVTYPRK